MKKFFVILSVACASILTSCDNENTVNPEPLGKAKISGVVYAEFDYTNNSPSTTYNTVANKKFIVEIWADDADQAYFMEGTTDANGAYTIELPVGARELEVGIYLVDFRQDVKYDASTTENEIFYGDGFSAWVDVQKGGEYIRDIYYND